MDFNVTFVLQIIALNFVALKEIGVVIVPGLYDLI
jgi:hypothetical protein